MGKGSHRRPEDAKAIARNWPLGTKWSRRDLSRKQAPVVVKCYFCKQPIPLCEHCGREHCPCVPLSNCQDNRPWQRRPVDPLSTTPQGFRVLERSGFAGGRSHE